MTGYLLCPAYQRGCHEKEDGQDAYDLAVQTDGATLPVKFKFGTDDAPVYRVFDRLADLTDFYTKAMRHIQNTLDAGWQKKDAFSLAQYQTE